MISLITNFAIKVVFSDAVNTNLASVLTGASVPLMYQPIILQKGIIEEVNVFIKFTKFLFSNAKVLN